MFRTERGGLDVVNRQINQQVGEMAEWLKALVC